MPGAVNECHAAIIVSVFACISAFTSKEHVVHVCIKAHM